MEDDFGTDEVAVKPFVVAGAGANGLWADVDGAPKTLVRAPDAPAERAVGNPEGLPKRPAEGIAGEAWDGVPKGFTGAVVCDGGAKGLKVAGAGDPNGEDVSPILAAKGFIAIEDGVVAG